MVEVEGKREKVTDPNSEIVRIQRALNQFEFYGIDSDHPSALATLQGKPLMQRLSEIRENLYPKQVQVNQVPFKDVGGQIDFHQVVSRKGWIPERIYPNITLVDKELLPNLCQVIDTLVPAFSRLESDKRQDASLRLGAVLYLFGIYLHPSADANGQTFQCALLSYLHELSLVWKEKYFPIKYTELYLPNPHRFPTPTDKISKIPIPLLPLNESHPHFSNHVRILETLKQLKTMPIKRYDRSEQTLEEYDAEIVRNKQQVISQIRDIGVFDRILDTQYDDWYDLNTDFYAIVSDYFLQDNFEPFSVNEAVRGTHTKSDVATYYESLMLNQKEGRRLLMAYVLGLPVDEVLEKSPELTEVWEVIREELANLENGMSDILNDEYISSVPALKTQARSAIVYKRMAERLEEKGLTYKWFTRITRNFT